MSAGDAMEDRVETATAGESLMKLKIKTLQPATYEVEVARETLISELKATLAAITDIPVERQRLIYRGHVLQDNQRLNDQGVEDGHTVHLVERPEGTAPPPSTGQGQADASQTARGSSRIAVGTVSLDGGTGADFERFLGGLLQSLGQQGAVAVPLGVQVSTTTTSTPLGTMGPVDGNTGDAGGAAPPVQNWDQLGTQLGIQIAQQVASALGGGSPPTSAAPSGGPAVSMSMGTQPIPIPIPFVGPPMGGLPFAPGAQPSTAVPGGPMGPGPSRVTRHALASLHQYLNTLNSQVGSPTDTAQPYITSPRGPVDPGLYLEGLREVLHREAGREDIQQLFEAAASAAQPPADASAGPRPLSLTPPQSSAFSSLTQLALSQLLQRLATFLTQSAGSRILDTAQRMEAQVNESISAPQTANLSSLTREVAAELHRTAMALMEMNRLLSVLPILENAPANHLSRVQVLNPMYINSEGSHPRRHGPPVPEMGGMPMVMGMGVNMAMPATSIAGHMHLRGMPFEAPPAQAGATSQAPPANGDANTGAMPQGVPMPGGAPMNPGNLMSAFSSAVQAMMMGGMMGGAPPARDPNNADAPDTTAQQTPASGPVPAPGGVPAAGPAMAQPQFNMSFPGGNGSMRFNLGSMRPPMGPPSSSSPAPDGSVPQPPGATRSTGSQTGQQVPGGPQHTAAVTIQISNGSEDIDMGGLLAGFLGGPRPDMPNFMGPMPFVNIPMDGVPETGGGDPRGPPPTAFGQAPSPSVVQALMMSILAPVVGTLGPTIVSAIMQRVSPQTIEAFMTAFQNGSARGTNIMDRIASVFRTSVEGIVEQLAQALETFNRTQQADAAQPPPTSQAAATATSDAQPRSTPTPSMPSHPPPVSAATVTASHPSSSAIPQPNPIAAEPPAAATPAEDGKGKAVDNQARTEDTAQALSGLGKGLGMSLPSRGRPAAGKVTPSKRPADTVATSAPPASAPAALTRRTPVSSSPQAPAQDPFASIMSMLGGPPGARDGGAGVGGRGRGAAGGGLLEMAAQMLNNPAVQNTMQQMLSAEDDGQPPNFGAMMQQAMPMVQQMFGAMGGPPRARGLARDQSMTNRVAATPEAAREELERTWGHEEARRWYDVIQRDVVRQAQQGALPEPSSEVYAAGYPPSAGSSIFGQLQNEEH